jgi:hypothetical protein
MTFNSESVYAHSKLFSLSYLNKRSIFYETFEL